MTQQQISLSLTKVGGQLRSTYGPHVMQLARSSVKLKSARINKKLCVR